MFSIPYSNHLSTVISGEVTIRLCRSSYLAEYKPFFFGKCLCRTLYLLDFCPFIRLLSYLKKRVQRNYILQHKDSDFSILTGIFCSCCRQEFYIINSRRIYSSNSHRFTNFRVPIKCNLTGFSPLRGSRAALPIAWDVLNKIFFRLPITLCTSNNGAALR